MTEEKISICKEILKNFIYKIRTNEICQLVFHYYTDSDRNDKNYPINTLEYSQSFNFDKVKKQIRKKILSVRNNYWNLDENKIKLVENICINNSEEFEFLKEYIEDLWTSPLEEQIKEFEKKEKEIKEKEKASLKIALGDKYDTYEKIVTLILKDKIEYPYKSDKIKVLSEINLDIDTIFKVLQLKEKNLSRSYVEKYNKEKIEEIKQRKVIYELNSVIKNIISQLKIHNN